MKLNGQEFPANGALRQEHEILALLENSPDLIFRLDSDLRFTYLSPAAERYTGVPRKQILGKRLLELQAPECEPPGLAAKCRQALDTGCQIDREFNLDDKYYRTRIIPQFVVDGSRSLFCFTEDITERKIAEQRLRQSQQQYELLVESIDGIIWEIDYSACNRFAFVSKQASPFWGRKLQSNTARSWSFMCGAPSIVPLSSIKCTITSTCAGV